MTRFTLRDCMSKQFTKVLDVEFPEPFAKLSNFAIFSKSKKGSFLGLVTSSEIALHPNWKFADFIKKKKCSSIKINSNIHRAFSKMEKEHIDVLPVLDKANHFVGIVTQLDLLRALYHDEHEQLEIVRKQQCKLNKANLNKLALIRRIQEQIHQMEMLDILTGLPNLSQIRLNIHQLLGSTDSKMNHGAILLVGLDNFREINDMLGSNFGDLVLQKVAQRIKEILPEGNLLARKGGDEFVILLVGNESINTAVLMAKTILNVLSQPFMFEEQMNFLTASIGISFFPFGEENVEMLLANADIALGRAKKLGKNTYQIFARKMGLVVKKSQEKEKYLRQALQREELFICYQPQVETGNNEIVGLEALLRWKNPELGLVLPKDFIPLAEKTGLIVPIGAWVLRTACSQLKNWQQYSQQLKISINLSARQFQIMHDREASYQLVRVIESVLKDSDIAPECLEIEITESAIMKNYAVVLAIFKKLKELGVRISCDDFGTGYSSLYYLKQFPIDVIKIDKTFIDDVDKDPADLAIIRAIILLANQLNLEVIAEGIETESQLTIMRELGCKIVQGYYYSRPLTLEDTTSLLQKGRL